MKTRIFHKEPNPKRHFCTLLRNSNKNTSVEKVGFLFSVKAVFFLVQNVRVGSIHSVVVPTHVFLRTEGA
jgi:hypothetical protein